MQQMSAIGNNTTDVNLITWEGHETLHTVSFILNTSFCLHVPLIIITNFVVILTFYYCQSLRTPDNIILSALAVSDFLTGMVGIPIVMIHHYDLGYFRKTKELCYLRWESIIFNYRFNLNIFTLLTIDRYLALCKPFWYIRNITNTTIAKAIFLCLIFQIIYLIVMAVFFRYDYNDKNLLSRCHFYTNSPLWLNTYFLLAITLFQLLLSFYCTVHVAITLVKKVNQLKHISRRHYERKTANSKITIILMFIYLCLNLPSLFLFYHTYQQSLSYATKLIILESVYHFRFINCWANAIIYAFSRKSYKLAYKYILTHWPHRWSGVAVVVREMASSQVSSYPSSRKSEVNPLTELQDEEIFINREETGESCDKKDKLNVPKGSSFSNSSSPSSSLNAEAHI